METIDIFLVTTEHLENRLWFKDDADFRVGMNYVAVLASTFDVHVLAFVLMSNHVHFVLACREDLAVRFINDLKKHHSQYLRKRYGANEHLRNNGVLIQRIPLREESFERAVAYVQMNSVAANICLNPSDYQWGTGDCFFNPKPLKGKPVGSLSFRARESMVHSRKTLLPNLIYDESGYILPASYVDTSFVESVFVTPKRMNYFLHNSSKAKKLRITKEDSLPAFRDQSISYALPDLCRSLFQKESIRELSQEQQTELFRQIKYRFASSIDQIARITCFPYETVANALDSF